MKKLLVKLSLTLTQHQVFLNIACTISTSHYSKSSFPKACIILMHPIIFQVRVSPVNVQNKNGICISTFWHKTKLNLISVHMLSNQIFL